MVSYTYLMTDWFTRPFPDLKPWYLILIYRVYINPQRFAKSYFRTFLACLTKFSITPSNASLSPIVSSVFLVQYSSASFAAPFSHSNLLTWSRSSSSVNPALASSVTLHSCLAESKSSPGAGGGAFLLLFRDEDLLPWESTEVEDVLALGDFRRDKEIDVRGEMGVDGRMSFFCLEAGRISSRSMGTPRETRKSLRMRERIQFGGWRGGGATSWDHREALREVKNVGDEEGADLLEGGGEEGSEEGGKMLSR